MDEVRYDPVWRRIRRDSYTNKFEGKFAERYRRLEHLANWGALTWLYPHATATKQAHHLGLEHNAARFLEADDTRARHRAPFRAAAHVAHWGHPPLSYQGAEALLRAAHVEPKMASLLERVIEEVVSFGDLDCRNDDHHGRCADRVLNGERPFELYRWLAAWIVTENWSRVWRAIRDAEADFGAATPDEKATRNALVRVLVCHEDRGFSVLDGCNKADYVPRDLLQCGTAWLTLDPDVLWENDPLGPAAAREWALIDSARSYLEDRFYSTPSSLLIHSLAARAIAHDLSGQSFGVAELRRLLEDDLGDAYFEKNLRPYHRARLTELREAARHDDNVAWDEIGVLRRVSLPRATRFAAEDFLTGRTGKRRLSYPFGDDYSVLVEFPHEDDFSAHMAGTDRRYGDVYCHHRRRLERQAVRPLLDALARVGDWIQRRNSADVGDALLSWILGSRVEQRARVLNATCGEIVLGDAEYIQARLRALRSRSSLVEINGHNEAVLWVDLFADPVFAQLSEPAGDLFLRLPWRAARMADGKAILTRIREKALERSQEGKAARRGAALELAVATDQMLADDDCEHRLLVVNATGISERGTPTCEWDVIRVDLLRGGDWTVTAVECAVNRSAAKDKDAEDKLDVLRRALLDKYSDLAWYRTWLASPGDERPRYSDAGRSYTRVEA